MRDDVPKGLWPVEALVVGIVLGEQGGICEVRRHHNGDLSSLAVARALSEAIAFAPDETGVLDEVLDPLGSIHILSESIHAAEVEYLWALSVSCLNIVANACDDGHGAARLVA